MALIAEQEREYVTEFIIRIRGHYYHLFKAGGNVAGPTDEATLPLDFGSRVPREVEEGEVVRLLLARGHDETATEVLLRR